MRKAVLSKPTSSATDRLNASRENLRSALMGIAHPPKQPSIFASGIGNIGTKLIDRVRAIPGIGVAIDSAEGWWHSHPLRTAAMAAAHTSGSLLAPVAKRRPKSLLLTAFGIGAMFVLVKPWRMLLRPAVMMGVVSQIVSYAAKGRSRSSWMQTLLGVLSLRRFSKKPVFVGAAR